MCAASASNTSQHRFSLIANCSEHRATANSFTVGLFRHCASQIIWMHSFSTGCFTRTVGCYIETRLVLKQHSSRNVYSLGATMSIEHQENAKQGINSQQPPTVPAGNDRLATGPRISQQKMLFQQRESLHKMFQGILIEYKKSCYRVHQN